MFPVRLSVSALTFFFLHWTGIFALLLPLVSWLTNLCVLLILSWAIGTFIARKYVLPYLPKTDPGNKAVVVTGCDSGFGYLSALKLNKDGFFVIATVLSIESEGTKKLEEHAVHKERIVVVAVDVTKEEDVRNLDQVVKSVIDSSDNSVNQLFGLVNNAGILLNRCIEFSKAPSVDDYKLMFDVNTFGVVRVTRMLLPLLRQSKGRVVTVSSQAARSSTPGFVGYSATKAATSKFTEGLQTELTKFGVTSIGIEPYFHKTEIVNLDFMTKSIVSGWDEAGDEVRQSYGTKARDNLISFTRFASSDPFFVNKRTEDVSDTIADALTSPEPQLVYECLQWKHWLARKLLVDFMPWNIAVPVNNLLLDAITRQAPQYGN